MLRLGTVMRSRSHGLVLLAGTLACSPRVILEEPATEGTTAGVDEGDETGRDPGTSGAVATSDPGAEGPTSFDPGTGEATSVAATSDDGASTTPGGGDETDGAVDPIVWTIGSDGITGREVSAFDGLDRYAIEYDERACSCTLGGAPKIAEPFLWLNGSFAPMHAAIHVGDRVGVMFPFADEDCDISCGAFTLQLTTPQSESGGGGSLGSNIPCDSTSTGVYAGVDFYEVDDPGTYAIQPVVLEDACGNQGLHEFSFEVLP